MLFYKLTSKLLHITLKLQIPISNDFNLIRLFLLQFSISSVSFPSLDKHRVVYNKQWQQAATHQVADVLSLTHTQHFSSM